MMSSRICEDTVDNGSSSPTQAENDEIGELYRGWMHTERQYVR